MAREYPPPDDDPKNGRARGRRDAHDGVDAGRNGPDAPDSWRSMLRPDYDYPDDLDELPVRDRRRAKKNWRRDDHAQRVAWLREQRQAEPTSPAVIVVLVVVVAIVIIGLGGGLPRLLGGDDPGDESPVGLLTPARPVVLPTPTSGGTTVPSPVSPTLSTPPIETARPGAQATALATDVVGAWARTFYTRDPGAETYAGLIAKASKYMTAEVAATFAAAGDSTYEALKTDGGKSTVIAAPVSAPRVDTAPTDTPGRITRFVNVTIEVTGKRAQRFDVPLLVTLTEQDGKWLISEVSGGTGP
jgi:hypothetical protein